MADLQAKYEKQLLNYYDEQGLLKQYPTKKPFRDMVLAKMAVQFEKDRDYTEKEINEIIKSQIDFTDYELIRRELYQNHILNRLIDGSKYWVE